jgi:uncharacterized protein YbcI
MSVKPKTTKPETAKSEKAECELPNNQLNMPTRGQLERSLSQSIQALYRSQLGHQPSKVSCRLLEQKLVIVMEDSITQTEQMLANEDQTELVQQVREVIDAAIEPSLKNLIEETSNIKVLDLLSDTTVETGRIGIIAVLESEPQTRS